MRSIRHWTPTYIRDRVTLGIRQLSHPDWPWLTAQAVEILESWLREADVGLEVGSGRSTFWFASRVSRLTSIEHDAAWFPRVSAKLKERGLADRVDYHFCPDGRNGHSGSYVKVISDLENESLDFVLIDGVARDYCAAVAIEKLKPGALLVIDNVNWFYARREKSRAPKSRSLADGFETPEWERVSRQIANWRVIWTTDGITDTALWVKPAG